MTLHNIPPLLACLLLVRCLWCQARRDKQGREGLQERNHAALVMIHGGEGEHLRRGRRICAGSISFARPSFLHSRFLAMQQAAASRRTGNFASALVRRAHPPPPCGHTNPGVFAVIEKKMLAAREQHICGRNIFRHASPNICTVIEICPCGVTAAGVPDGVVLSPFARQRETLSCCLLPSCRQQDG